MWTMLATMLAAAGQAPADSVTLLQISVERPAGQSDKDFSARVDALKAAVAGVTTCDAGVGAAARAKAELLVRPNVPLTALPAELREQIAAGGQGKPTELFGSRDAVRVLLSCPSAFAARLAAPATRAPIGR
jgi:hypothetical protein